MSQSFIRRSLKTFVRACLVSFFISSCAMAFMFAFPEVWSHPIRKRMEQLGSDIRQGPVQISRAKLIFSWPLGIRFEKVNFPPVATGGWSGSVNSVDLFLMWRPVEGHWYRPKMDIELRLEHPQLKYKPSVLVASQPEVLFFDNLVPAISWRPLVLDFGFKTKIQNGDLEIHTQWGLFHFNQIRADIDLPQLRPVEWTSQIKLNGRLVSGLQQKGFLPVGLEIRDFHVRPQELKSDQISLDFGGVRLEGQGRVDLENRSQELKLKIPSVDLSQMPVDLLPEGKWQGILLGEWNYKQNFTGEFESRGEIEFQRLKGDIQHVWGHFKSQGGLLLRGRLGWEQDQSGLKIQDLNLQADLSPLEITWKDEFKKRENTPFQVDIVADSKDGALLIRRGRLALKAAAAEWSGRILLDNQWPMQLQVHLPSFSLRGVEEFFPKVTRGGWSGWLGAQFEIKGDLLDSKTQELRVQTLNVKSAKGPIEYFNNEATLRGTVATSFDFKGDFKNQKWNELMVQGWVDFSEAQLSVSDFLNKPPGRKLKLPIEIHQSGTQINKFNGSLSFESGEIGVALLKPFDWQGETGEKIQFKLNFQKWPLNLLSDWLVDPEARANLSDLSGQADGELRGSGSKWNSWREMILSSEWVSDLSFTKMRWNSSNAFSIGWNAGLMHFSSWMSAHLSTLTWKGSVQMDHLVFGDQVWDGLDFKFHWKDLNLKATGQIQNGWNGLWKKIGVNWDLSAPQKKLILTGHFEQLDLYPAKHLDEVFFSKVREDRVSGEFTAEGYKVESSMPIMEFKGVVQLSLVSPQTSAIGKLISLSDLRQFIRQPLSRNVGPETVQGRLQFGPSSDLIFEELNWKWKNGDQVKLKGSLKIRSLSQEAQPWLLAGFYLPASQLFQKPKAGVKLDPIPLPIQLESGGSLPKLKVDPSDLKMFLKRVGKNSAA